MAYIRFTKNPKNETNDCIIRSIANATNKEWKEVMAEMCDIALENYLMPNDYQVAQEYMNRRDYQEDYTYPSDNMTVEKFCNTHPEGNFVLLVPDHALSVINGDFYDLTNSANSEVLSYWEVK